MSAPPPPPIEFFLVLRDGSCVPATAKTCTIVMKQARSEARKQARIRRMEKAAELQCALEDRAAARRFHQELAEIERDRIRYAARFRVVARPAKPDTRTSPVKKRLVSSRMSGLHRSFQPPTSSWVVDDRGMRGVSWQQSYLGRKSASFYRGAAKDHWEYLARDEAVLLGLNGEPVIVSNMGEDWVEIGAAWQAMEDASTRANAKIQIRSIVAFDADARPEEMAESLRHFCETILAPLDLPYSAVIHAPPEHGDERNYHGHIALSLRPMRRVAPYEWEVADEVRGELDGRDGVQMLRHLWAHSMSEAAERARRNIRYTGLGYGARGLDLDAGEHLGEGRSAIVARGEHVWAQERNRLKSERNAARLAIRDTERKIAALTTIRNAALARLAREQLGAAPAQVLHSSRAPQPAEHLPDQSVSSTPEAVQAQSSPMDTTLHANTNVTRPQQALQSPMPPKAAQVLSMPLSGAASSPRPSAMFDPQVMPHPAAGISPTRAGASVTAPVVLPIIAAGSPATAAILPLRARIQTVDVIGRLHGDPAEPRSLSPRGPVREPISLALPRSAQPPLTIQPVASEPAHRAIRLPQPRAAAPGQRLDLPERPQDRTMLDEPVILFRALDRSRMLARAARKREAARRRERQTALFDLPTIAELPTLDALPTRERLEARTVLPPASVLSGKDRIRVDHLIRIDAYVADYQAGALGLHPAALRAIGVDETWSRKPDVQAELARLRADQQRVVAGLAREALRRPLDFASTGTRFWPRDLAPSDLLRLDCWAPDDGFQRDVFDLERGVLQAHVEREQSRSATSPTAAFEPIPDGFGGRRDTPAPAYRDHGPHTRTAAFDSYTGKPTDQLLLLLKLAGEHPNGIVFASDARLMALSDTPAPLAPLLHGWRDDTRVVALVTDTVRASRAAGRPVWPPEVAPAVRRDAARDAAATNVRTSPGPASPRSR